MASERKRMKRTISEEAAGGSTEPGVCVRTKSSVSSAVSLKSDRSMEHPPDFSLEAASSKPQEKSLLDSSPRAQDLRAQDLRAQDLRAQDLRAQDLRAQDLRAQDLRPKTSGPKTSGPKTSGPKTSGPKTSGPKTSGPKTSGPKTSERHKVCLFPCL
uniref:Uncharacterized protein n=1 Tax=Knipowitschia caucasica TaxID=637954 RepID=A0AAV2MGK0_KNICA